LSPHADLPTAQPLRAAESGDGPAIEALLREHALPVSGVSDHLADFLVTHGASGLTGCVGLEFHGDGVLLRSVVARTGHQGLGGQMVRAALRQARQRGAQWAVLRTTTAEGFFAQQGFRRVESTAVPTAVKASVEFRGACPDSSTTMIRDLRAGVSVRAAREDDMAAVLDIYNEEVRHSTATYQYAERTLDEQVAQWLAKRADGHRFFVAVTDDDHVVGYANYGLFRPREGWRFTCEHSVYLHRDWRGRGLGKLLLPAVMAHARERGFHSMVGVVDAANGASVRLHESMGFTVAGVIREGGYKFDRWLDVAFLQAAL
jgi:L-amino acid N-acyltransferase YncA